jgi:hypothetical protein
VQLAARQAMAWVLAIPITKARAANIAIRFMVISNALLKTFCRFL